MNCDLSKDNTPVRTALLLAAGMGSRLSPLTDSSPKCLVEVNGTPILEKLIRSLRSHGFKRLVVVTGHLSEVIQDYLGNRYADIEITYIHSTLYKTTNNIYSLWLAKKVIDEPFLLIESDLVFQPELLKPMLQPDRIAISKQLPWMNGTTVTLNKQQQLDAFWTGSVNRNGTSYFKTVNIYSFSRRSWQLIWERLNRHISAKKVEGYYESAFAELVAEGSLAFAPVFFDADQWYEIDTLKDLSAAEQMFPAPSPIRAVAQQLQPLVQKVAPIAARNIAEIKKTVIGGNPTVPFSPLVTSD